MALLGLVLYRIYPHDTQAKANTWASLARDTGPEMSDPLTVRATVHTVLHEHELVADRFRIAVGDAELATDAIEEVGWTWSTEPSEYKTFLIHSYDFTLKAGSERLWFVYKSSADWSFPRMVPIAAAIIRLLETCVYPRIAREIVGRLDAGEFVQVAGGWRLDREGMYVGFRKRAGFHSWKDVRDLGIERGKIVFGFRNAKGGELKLGTATKLANAVVLPFVLAEMQSRPGLQEPASPPPS